MKRIVLFCIKTHVLACMILGGTAYRRPHAARGTRALPLVAAKGCLKIILAAVALVPVLRVGAATVTWVSTGTNDWSNTNSWSTTNVPAAGDDVIINYTNVGVLLTNATAELSSLLLTNKATLIFSNWDTKLSATNVTIVSTGLMTCAGPFTNTAMSNRVWLACSNLTIAGGGSINVNGKGYDRGTSTRNGQGPGGGTTGGNGGGGGGHGGYGGNGYNGGRGSPYGSTNAPEYPGSGGGGCSGYGNSGSAGGGAVRIDATGLITVNGRITANGDNQTSEQRGGQGSGGSIYITCNTFNGTNGAIIAAGGTNSSSAPVGGAGGGGRIAIVFNPSAQSSLAAPTVVFSAEHGILSYGAVAEIGTLYFPSNTLFNAAWMAHAGLVYIPDFPAWSVDSFTMTNGWVDFPATPAFALTVTNALTVRGAYSKLYLRNGTIACGSLVLTNSATLWLGSYSTKSNSQSITCGGNLELGPSSGVRIYAAETNAVQTNRGALINVTNDIRIDNGAYITLYTAYTNGASAFLQMRNLTIATGGQIYADSAGYAGALASYTAGYGPGKGAARGDNNYGGSGGYGGAGGSGYGVAGGATYGSSNAPTEPGSGGGAGLYALYGGGLAHVEARETVTVNGTITANGGAGTTQSGSGSGGGIYIRCRNFSGSTNGILRANGGGVSGTASSGGGGGRIAVWRMYHFFAGSVSATNGTGTTYNGQKGTVVWGDVPVAGTIFKLD